MNRKLVRRAANKLEYEQPKLQWQPCWPAVNQRIQQKNSQPTPLHHVQKLVTPNNEQCIYNLILPT